MKLNEIIKRAIFNGEEYTKLINNILDTIKTANQGNCKDVISLTKKVIKDKHALPSAKLRGLNLFHACMMLNNYHFLMFTQKKVMSRFTILAKHRKDRTDDRRGEDLFGLTVSEPEKDASAQFLKNLLQYIQIWASHFGRGPDGQPSIFYRSYNSLVKEKVQFPDSGVFNKSSSSNAIPAPKRGPELKPSTDIPKPAQSQQNDSRSLKRRVEKEISTATNTLELFQEMINTGADHEMISELIANIRSQKAQFESEIESLLYSGEEVLVQKVLSLNEQLQVALNIYMSAKDNFSEEVALNSKNSKENRAKVQIDKNKKNRSEVDVNLLDLKLDFGSPHSDFSNLEFATQPPGRPSIEHNFHTSQMGFYNSSKIPNLRTSPERHLNVSSPDIIAPIPVYMSPSPVSDFHNPLIQLQTLMKTNEELEKNFKLAAGKIQQLESELTLMNQENMQLKVSFRDIKSSNKELQHLRADNLKLKSEIEQILVSQEQFNKIFPEFQQQLIYKEKLIQDKSTESNSLKDQIVALKRELDELRSREHSNVTDQEFQSKSESRYRTSYPAEASIEFSTALKSPTIESKNLPQPKGKPKSFSSSESSSSSDLSMNLSSNPFIGNSSYEQQFHSYGANYDMSEMISRKSVEEVIVNEDLFRVCCLGDKGVLYDDDSIQVGIQILTHGNQARAQIYIGNKSSEKITRLETEVLEYPEDGITVQINQTTDDTEYLQGTQANRVILFNATSNFTRIPKLIMKVSRNNDSNTYTLKLPVTIARFMQNSSILPNEILSIWDELAGKENSQVISELAPWLKSLSEMVFGIRLGGSVDVHGSWDIEGLDQGVILAITQKDDILILARIEINSEKRTANLKLRSKGLKLRDTLMILLAEQLSGRTLTI